MNRKKKYFGLALALGALVSVSEVSEAAEYGGGFWNQGMIDVLNDGDTIKINGGGVSENHGLYVNGSNSYSAESKNNITIKTGPGSGGLFNPRHWDGIRSNPGGVNDWVYGDSRVTIGDGWTIINDAHSGDGINWNGGTVNNLFTAGDGLTITTSKGEFSALGQSLEGSHGVRANFHGHVLIGDRLQITTKGRASYAIYATQGPHGGGTAPTLGSTIQVGDNAIVKTEGIDSHAVFLTSSNGSITMGNFANITTTKNGAYGVAIDESKQTDEPLGGINGTVILGNASWINTSGSNAHAIYAGGVNGSIILGQDSIINTTGNGSYGLYGRTSRIQIGNGLQITTSGSNSHAVYADTATGSVEFKGGATLLPTIGTGSYAIYSKAGTITSQLDGSGNVSNLDGGNFQIFGDMKTDAGGKIDMRLGNGSLFVGSADQGAGNINLVLQNGSKWYVTQDKNADVTVEAGGELFLGGPSVWSTNYFAMKNDGTLTVNGGTIHFLTDISTVTSDLYTLTNQIQGTGGVLKVASIGSAATDGTEEVVLVKGKQDATNGAATFTLENGSVDQGGYSYVLDSRVTTTRAPDREWYLRATKASGAASGGVNVFSGAYLLNYAETQTLLQRLGDLRQGESNGDLWARAYGGKFTSASDGFLSGYDMTYHGFQVGVDRKKELANHRSEIYYGGFAGYGKGNLDYGRGNGSVDSKTLGIYGTYIAPSGLYTDLVLKHVWMKNDFNVLDSAGASVNGGKMNTNGLSASIEVGKRYHLNRQEKQGWYVEPQAQLSVGQQSGGSFKASNGLRIDVESYTSVLSRVGTNVGYEIKEGKNPINGYVKFSHVHEFNGDVDYRLNGSKESTSYGDSWWTWGLGVTAQINKKHNIYLDVERASGGQFNQPWAINGGYRFSW